LVQSEIPKPKPASDEISIKIKAFGLNHAELYMRSGNWPDNKVPVIGIECVGLVEEDPSGKLKKGTKVAAIMGGMGRSRNGSYAEYTAVPAANVFALETDMDWADLAALPESYATAWGSLFDELGLSYLDLNKVLLVRGATSTLGQAAVNIASEMGIKVLATTRSEKKAGLLKSIGASEVFIEDQNLGKSIKQAYPDGIDYVYDLIGNNGFRDSMGMVKKGGKVCVAGFLGGLEPVQFDVLSQTNPGVSLSLFGSFMLGSKNFPISSIPMQTIVNRAAVGLYKAKPVKVFRFQDLPAAHQFMESGNANGKIVVTI